MCSIWNRSPGTRKPFGKHPLDGEMFLNKNKKQTKSNNKDINVVHSLQGRSALKVIVPVGVKGRKGSRAPCEVHRSKALRCRRSLKCSEVLGRQLLQGLKGLQGQLCGSMFYGS